MLEFSRNAFDGNLNDQNGFGLQTGVEFSAVKCFSRCYDFPRLQNLQEKKIQLFDSMQAEV